MLCSFGGMSQGLSKLFAKGKSYHYNLLVTNHHKTPIRNISPDEQPYQKLMRYDELDDLNSFIATYLKTVIYQHGYTMLSFERKCKSMGYRMTRRTINGLIKKDRGNIRLSYFTFPFILLGITYEEVLRAYIAHKDRERIVETT